MARSLSEFDHPVLFIRIHINTYSPLLIKRASQLAPPTECQQPIIYEYFGQIAYFAIHKRFVV